jgi:hypothetical protein
VTRPSPLPTRAALGQGTPAWYQAYALVQALTAARTGSARVYRLRIYRDYVEAVFVVDVMQGTLEKVIWRDGVLMPPAPVAGERLARREGETKAVRLDSVLPEVIAALPGKVEAETRCATCLTALTLEVEGGKGFWHADWGKEPAVVFTLEGERPRAP